jgi:hypothetical protein
MDVAAVFRRHKAQVQHIGLQARALDDLLRYLGQSPGL